MKDDMYVSEFEDLKSGMTFTVAFECLNDFTDFIKIYQRPLECKFVEPVFSFGFDPMKIDREKHD